MQRKAKKKNQYNIKEKSNIATKQKIFIEYIITV